MSDVSGDDLVSTVTGDDVTQDDLVAAISLLVEKADLGVSLGRRHKAGRVFLLVGDTTAVEITHEEADMLCKIAPQMDER